MRTKWTWTLSLMAALTASACDTTPQCGLGTHVVGDACVVDAAANRCGANTRLVGTECIADDPSTCGPGTVRERGTCVPEAPPCGPGTREDQGRCVPEGGALTCGAGTIEQAGVCVPSGGAVVTCGAGTVEQAGVCVPSGLSVAYYDVRVGVREMAGDGRSRIPVFAIGRLADGTPSTEEVVFLTSRPNAGGFQAVTQRPGAAGLETYFIPCNVAQTPSCAGTFRIQLALGRAPTQVVAQTPELTITDLEGVGSTAPCMAGGNVIYFDGDTNDYVHAGVDTITQGSWRAQTSGDFVSVHIDPTDRAQGLWWDLEFSSRRLGQPLAEQVYEGVERYPFESANTPGFWISGDGRGCNMVSGRFQIHELVANGSQLSRFTATFEQHCEGGPAMLRGCVHWEQ
jgi:hypothetical protein